MNTQATSRSLRHLAREGVERGERLVDIARRLKIAPSTIHHWAREDGFRRKDVRARASLAQGPQLTGKADYPEPKDMAPRARLERLGELSGEARLRAVAAIEEGYLDYGLKWLREAQKLERGHKALKAHLEHYPPPEEEEDGYVWDQLDEDALAEIEGREPEILPPPPPPTPREMAEAAEDRKIDAAIEEARLERMIEERDGRTPTDDEIGDDRLANFIEDLREFERLKEEVKKWRLFPGRGDPPPLRAVSRGRSILPEVAESPSPPLAGERGWGEGAQQRGPDAALNAESEAESPSFVAREIAGRFPDPSDPLTPNPLSPGGGEGAKSGGPRLYGIEEAFPVKFTRRE